MSKQKQAPKLRVRTAVKASGPVLQHGLRVRTRVKAGNGGFGSSGIYLNHGLRVRVRTGVKAGGAKFNHGVRIGQASR